MNIAAAQSISAYKRLPSDVVEPFTTLLSWLLWVALVACLGWLLVAAGRMWIMRHEGQATSSEGPHGVVMSLLGAIVATSSTAIALAILS
ncbi:MULTISPECIES: hypothetical protein [unclassified Nocardia]|uniref:hypothetical protein n=1 Tax=unclassified Nocardia TaxID=2637762 RepID=UPI001CE40AB5|nr:MULTISPECIES: hypothetical protein [unclassified Nocardia]